MPVITQTIAFNERRPEVNQIQDALISVGYTIGPDELHTPAVPGKFGPETQANLIAFLQPFTVGDDMGDPFNAAWGRLLHIAVPAELANTARLYAAVSECFDAIDVPPAPSWFDMFLLARYATMARNFTIAKKVIDRIGQLDPIVKAVAEEAASETPKPEVLNPENYYTFAYDYVSRADVQALMQGSKVRTR